MKNVKTPTSDSYRDYLISRLRDPNYAAAYLETHLEEENLEPELLRLALSNILEALSPAGMNPEEAQLHRQKLDILLSQSGGTYEIHSLANWLNKLGLKLTVTISSKL